MEQQCNRPQNRLLSRCAERGQSLVFIALVLAFLTPFVFTVIEFSERQLEVAHMEDALQQATRSAVQLFDYEYLARNSQRIDEERAVQTAKRAFVDNIGAVLGLAEAPETLAQRVTWRVLPQGGSCRFSNEQTITFDQPAVCAEVRPTMTGFGLLGYAPYQPLITAAATLDRLDR
ncbi:MAG: hypothetical protein C0183_07770 [Roseiflexus castenholzii]|uniref:hypothetical protein n=1 Tax=Roseiflexus castenholzii TaxID=120962 RepID=UPI000CCB2969|nr:MAG: hypothetical protein C0183_07770 [Roseiflexus castenholzii]